MGPLGDWYRSSLPQTGDWSGTLGSHGTGDAAAAAGRWQETVIKGWRELLARRTKLVVRWGGARVRVRRADENVGGIGVDCLGDFGP